jgi:hypothetical protein
MRYERSRTVRFAGAVALAASVALAAACGGSSNATTVTAPTGTLVTDSFSGTVPMGGVGPIHQFTVTVGGTISVTLLTAGPPPTITMGLAIGTPSGTTCALLSGGSTVTPAGSTAQLSGPVNAGTYCVEVVDVGNAAGPITYTLSVAHT